MLDEGDIKSSVQSIASASLASLISLLVLRTLGFNRSGELTTFQFIEFFLLIMGAILFANLLSDFDKFGLSATTILVLSYFFGERVIWTLSSQQALANPEIQSSLLLFAGFVLIAGVLLAFAVPVVALPRDDP